jgi:hypothetical protein
MTAIKVKLVLQRASKPQASWKAKSLMCKKLCTGTLLIIDKRTIIKHMKCGLS